MPKKRRADRSEKDWDDATQTEGLASRIKFTPPEEKVVLRSETEKVTAEIRRGIRWDELIDLMVEKGLLARTDDERTFVKKSEGLGEEKNPTIKTIIEEGIEEKMDSLDIRDPEQRKKFIELCIREELQSLYGTVSRRTHAKVLEMVPSMAEELTPLIVLPVSMVEPNRPELEKYVKGDTYATLGLKVAEKLVEFIGRINSPEISSQDYKKLVEFFSNLRGMGGKIANHKYNCGPNDQENIFRNMF